MSGEEWAESARLTDAEREQRCRQEQISHEHYTREAVERIVAGRLAAALSKVADEIEAVADDAMNRTSRSFHPQGTHADGRRDGCWEGRMDAARIIRAALAQGTGYPPGSDGGA